MTYSAMSASTDRGGLSKSCRTFGYIGCCTCLRGRLFCCYQAEQRAIPWSSKNKKYRKRLELYQAGKPSLRQVKVFGLYGGLATITWALHASGEEQVDAPECVSIRTIYIGFNNHRATAERWPRVLSVKRLRRIH